MGVGIRIFGLALFILLTLPLPGTAAEGAHLDDKVVRSQLDHLETEKVETFWQELKREYGRFFPKDQPSDLFDLVLSGGEEVSWKHFLSALGKYLFHEVLYNGKLLGTIIVLTVFSMILRTLQTAFERNQVSKIAYAIAFMVIIILAVDSFTIAVDSAKEAISRMIHFMLALVPLVLTLLASMGNFGSVGMFHPMIVLMIHVIGTLIHKVVFPVLFFSAILGIISCLSEKYKVNQLANLLRKVAVGILGTLLTVFLGIISVQGATAAVTDGVTIRTAKYVTGNFVPVVGRMFSDAADTVVGASLLVKNAVGLAGVIILLLIIAFPALKILSLALVYSFAAAVMQPLGDSPIIECLSIISKTLIYIFASLATVGMMFFLAITIIVASGNISVMIR
ncbi:stage III sporulation protein AE [Melghirimyces profundicolus]|uniref:Stage III sporulation protein AE n=1 Tax=Melghirimyces profundicolus TaxID=1242148 RepID=A0A2T6BD03_9BACL|nr:stage III sporulation protein AE [Melghirimyces profundicolus]PTX53919.1 stage III sporulation protein AE [Melghirimyces profundicolus]